MGEIESNLLLDIITDILGTPRKKNKTKSQYSFDCPVCSAQKDMPQGDGKGNLEVNISKNAFHCWACGEEEKTHGSIGKLILRFGNKEQKKKLKKLGIEIGDTKAKTAPIKEVTDITLPEEYRSFKDSNSNDIVYKQAWNYLTKERKISPDIIYKYSIGFTSYGPYDHRIILPSYDSEGKLNYFTARTWLSNKKPKYKNPDLPREEVIFNEKFINWDSTVYLVEGPFDHVVVYNSIPMLGKELHDKLYDLLMKKCNAWVVVLLDDDAWVRAKQIYSKLNVGRLHGRVRIIKMKDGYDIAKVNEDFGREGVVDVLRSAFKPKESTL